MSNIDAQRILGIKDRIVQDFSISSWQELGVLVASDDIINSHNRLLRSLNFNDDDYEGNVLQVLTQINRRDPNNLKIIEQYIESKFSDGSTYISALPSERKITFSPSVFKIPDGDIDQYLVSVMMPFSMNFNGVYEAIKKAASFSNLRCLRADNIWEETTIIQDIFNLIYRAHIVIVDFTDKNPNVMYETGIAHALGKHVIPITQSLDHVPFDMRHHRVLKYLNNSEGLSHLTVELQKKLKQTVPF